MTAIAPDVFGIQEEWQPGEFRLHVRRVPAQNETRQHEHLFHEIVLVEAGTAQHATAAGTATLHPGDVLVFKPRVWHQYRAPRGLTIVNCLFDGAVLRQYDALFSLTRGAFDLYRRPSRHPRNTPPVLLHASPSQRAQLANSLDAMMSELREKTTNWQASATVRLLEFLIAVARLRHPAGLMAPIPMANRAKEAVIEATNHLETRFAEPIRLEALSQALHVSPSYLSRSFAHQMGMGIVRYLNHIRIEEACRLLRYTDAPIGDVGDRVGYNEVSYFTRCFHQAMSMTPRAYRRTSRHAPP